MELKRCNFITTLPLIDGDSHEVSREDIFSSVITLFRLKHDIIAAEIPLRISFKGERALDAGGVSREMFSAFFEVLYTRHFDGAGLLHPVVNPHVKDSDLRLFGFIISCAYISSGILPMKISFPCLSAILLPNPEVPDKIFIHGLLESISVHDAEIIREGFKYTSEPCFSTLLQAKLVDVLGSLDCREVPNPQRFHDVVVDVANYHLLRKPSSVISGMHAGIPQIHSPFWQGLECTEFFNVYQAMQATPSKVLEMLSDVMSMNPKEEKVICYLRQYIGNMRQNETQAFLRFVTGSSACSSNPLLIVFNSEEGMARRPIAHTCGFTLELSTQYDSYSDFAGEFSAVLSNSDGLSWRMDVF